MKNKVIYSMLCMLVALVATGQNNQYLGQKPPGLTPQKFAPQIISTESEYEFGSVFSKDGLEFFYGVSARPSEIRYTQFKEGEWTTPEVILSAESYGMNDPFLSPDENRLYYISKKDTKSDGAKNDHDIWYSEKEKGGWSAPINVGPNINTPGNEYYISFTNTGTMYFSSNIDDFNHDIYYSKYQDGQFQEKVRLGPEINTEHYEGDVFMAPDESYIIVAASRPDGKGQGDLYISFKQADGSWSQSKNMGEVINTPGHELCPFVTADGKYLFYTSRRDIYWVDAEIIEQLR